MKFNAFCSGTLVATTSGASGSVLIITSGGVAVFTCTGVFVAGGISIGLGFSFNNCPLSSAVSICLLCPSLLDDELGWTISGPKRVFRIAQFLGVYELGTSTV